jgi:hypothetical protein
MDREEIKDGYLDRYFELKMYDMFDMLEIIYGKIDADDCGVNDINVVFDKILKMAKMNLW